jgi:hypothetical protein
MWKVGATHASPTRLSWSMIHGQLARSTGEWRRSTLKTFPIAPRSSVPYIGRMRESCTSECPGGRPCADGWLW